ncbi:type I glyceraldehyde-3-phosphate dehydrogenase [Thiotrichales bacterium 19S3-7]|nr:type I glyceraldehyde-3-phosphate dehydrogenase [Thiotrichales bacterium 19S3-7]MCF6801508.1 type I glyceraldehyde-3-phosphate dehydrogenase [Thiotrichales bacterium 19S3-11]
MSIRIAINGYGRIGRLVLRALYEGEHKSDIEIVAINDLGAKEANVHLTKYDSVHGRFNADVSLDGDDMVVNGDRIKLLSERNPADLPWGELNVDMVYECTGIFTSKEKASAHLTAGAKKVLISAPGGNDVDATVVYGVNHSILKASDTVVSNASCTTNCLAPIAKVLNEAVGIVNGLMTTVHAYTNDQNTVDALHKDLRRARAAAVSIIPSKTGAAAAVGLVLPELNGKLDGFAMRIPSPNVSVVDLTFNANYEVSVDEINRIMKEASQRGPLQGILGYSDEPLVSIDYNHDPRPSVFDATQTRVQGKLVKVISWYDNEWGFSNQMLRTTKVWMAAN